MTRRVVFALALVALSPLPAVAQAPASPEVLPVVPIGSRVGGLPTGYEDGGRRDPFASLVVVRRPVATGNQSTARPRAGLAGVPVADVTVRGIVRRGDTMMAILETPNRQSFVARANDRLADGAVYSIDAEGVVFAEGSPTSTIRIRKALRSTGEDF